MGSLQVAESPSEVSSSQDKRIHMVGFEDTRKQIASKLLGGQMEDEEKLVERLYKNLKGRQYLIVMDDLWDTKAWVDLKRLFPEDRNGSRVLFTSRPKNVASKISHVIIEPSPLSPGESKNLLELVVFRKERCPQELQDIGKKIAITCHGLPLSLVMIAGVLSNMEKNEKL
ncbi:putative late blight resistance protein homolog R1A-3 [Olea europaea var. sylvestris]|uniref:putative late blight resistance protein homolog R1A-3 n=1 Tax=Olea europaea var. sylvestris TaxID=158386 RepID=UPI000C1D1F76|nr:putative late blight resistance protein homolog R1A-3 [Olea europaea var. sylvestris]